jgi:hypothetical protein
MFSDFLADRPVLKDRLFACAVFSGIAVGGVSGVNMVLSGGFDFITPGREVREAAPSSYVTIVPSNVFEQAAVIPMASREPLFAGAVRQVSEDLDGASTDTTVPRGHYPAAADDQSGDALYEQLAARYDDQSSRTARDIQPAIALNAAPAASDGGDARFDQLEAQVRQAIPASAMPDKPPA